MGHDNKSNGNGINNRVIYNNVVILKALSMRDKISLDRATLLHPAVRQEVIDCIEKAESGFINNHVLYLFPAMGEVI